MVTRAKDLLSEVKGIIFHAVKPTAFLPYIQSITALGLLINVLGWGLAFRAGVGVLLTALTIPPLLARIRAEERQLRTEFGVAYGTYCVRTSRLIPELY